MTKSKRTCYRNQKSSSSRRLDFRHLGYAPCKEMSDSFTLALGVTMLCLFSLTRMTTQRLLVYIFYTLYIHVYCLFIVYKITGSLTEGITAMNEVVSSKYFPFNDLPLPFLGGIISDNQIGDKKKGGI